MSIHPQYADAILRGDKTVEFRKRGFSHPVSHVLIYATAPRKLVLGYFVVDAMLALTRNRVILDASPTA
jgi:predicted transcriptional regulator